MILVGFNGQEISKSEQNLDNLRLMCSLSNHSIPYEGASFGISRITRGTSKTEYIDNVVNAMTEVLDHLDGTITFESFDADTSRIVLKQQNEETIEVQYED